MRLGRLVLGRGQAQEEVVVVDPSVRVYTLIVSREGVAPTGTALYPKTATASFAATAADVVAITTSATVPNRITTAEDIWLTSP